MNEEQLEKMNTILKKAFELDQELTFSYSGFGYFAITFSNQDVRDELYNSFIFEGCSVHDSNSRDLYINL